MDFVPGDQCVRCETEIEMSRVIYRICPFTGEANLPCVKHIFRHLDSTRKGNFQGFFIVCECVCVCKYVCVYVCRYVFMYVQ